VSAAHTISGSVLAPSTGSMFPAVSSGCAWALWSRLTCLLDAATSHEVDVGPTSRFDLEPARKGINGLHVYTLGPGGRTVDVAEVTGELVRSDGETLTVRPPPSRSGTTRTCPSSFRTGDLAPEPADADQRHRQLPDHADHRRALTPALPPWTSAPHPHRCLPRAVGPGVTRPHCYSFRGWRQRRRESASSLAL
jgi:hypothetical protein